ncbi:MAG: hypothetical protein AB3K77_02965 [Methanosarcinaceae archaeon]|uniref:hypothetical protein n=1 Tax=Methanosarcina sp. MTP4 TaxID=1434100 RepID=UPI00064F1A9E|nr:hypothetical protein [Methanosarcina sp. MTP4]
MFQEDFLLEEYKSLREEILDKMGKNFKTLSLGVGGITIILGFVFKYEVNELFFVLPFLIVANAYRYKAETAAILNASEYIRKIENSIYRLNSNLDKCVYDPVFGDLGWENYLEKNNKRTVYRPHWITADFIFGSLYFLCAYESWYLNLSTRKITTIFFTIVFIFIGFHWLHQIYKQFKMEKENRENKLPQVIRPARSP